MAFTSNWPVQNTAPSLSSSMGGGWGLSGQSILEQQKNETLFNSLLPVNGMVTGEQVKPVFQASGLPQNKLAQIWSMVDLDRDGRINKTEFSKAMGLMQKARQQERPSLFQSQPSSGFFSTPQSSHQFSTPTPPTAAGAIASTGVSHSTSVPTFKQQPVAPPPATPTGGGGGVGRKVSLVTLGDGWAMKMNDRRKYIMEFNTHDKNMTGYLAGAEARPILTKSGLDQATLAQIWTLSDIDKDGRLTVEEFAVAMHLVEKAKSGLAMPSTLPSELKPVPGQVKFHTVDRVPRGSVDRTRKPSVESAASFEDRRKENFEAGRMELDRRRKALQEQQEKEAAEKERKKREEEERRKQQELEAELARQAELERQRKKALEIELERERQMQKLAMQREAEQRELERQRKEEWARRRQLELEGQREWERKTLRTLMEQRSELEEKLNQLDQRKLIVSASVERHKTLCNELSGALRSLRLSHEVRKALLTKLQSEFVDYQAQLSSLERQRKDLQEALQSRSPEELAFQRQRQQYRDKIMGLAACLAGMRTNLTITSESVATQEEAFSKRNKQVEGLRSELRSSEPKVKELRMVVGMRKKAWDDHQRKLREAAERQAEMERKQREEKERLSRMAEERAQREVRLAKIRQQQEEALRKVREEKASETTKPPSKYERRVVNQESPPKERKKSATPPGEVITPIPVAEPVGRAQVSSQNTIEERLEKLFSGPASAPAINLASKPPLPPSSTSGKPPPPVAPTPRKKKGKKEEREKDKEVLKKVQELQKQKAELQRQRELQAKEAKKVDSPISKKKPPPVRPAPYAHKVSTSAILQAKQGLSTPPTKPKKPAETTALEEPLVDLQSSWDSSAQDMNALRRATSTEILVPMKSRVKVDTVAKDAETPTDVATTKVGDKPTPKRRLKAERPLSQLFEKTGAGEYVSNTHAGSSEEGDVPTFKPIQEPVYSVVKKPRAAERKSAAGSASVQDHDIYIQYRAKYNFEAGNPSEVSFKEGDVITLGAHLTEEASPGWVWVEVGGSKGWAPELYLEPLENEGRDGGVGEAESEEAVVEMSEEEMKTAVLSPELPQPVRARVKFSWQGSKDNHLSIQRGKVITVLQQSDKWWSGEANGKVGWFPKSFVTIIEEEPPLEEQTDVPTAAPSQPAQEEQPLPDSTPQTASQQDQLQAPSPGEEGTGPALYEAIYDYEGEADGDLSFKARDVIQVIAREGVWWTGILGGEKGEFPCNYVQKRRSPSPTGSATSFTSESSSTVSLQTKPVIARALVAFHAQQKGQLSLSPGEYIKVRKQAASGWWEGELQSRGKQRQAGWFPANRVEVLTTRSGSGSGASNIIRARSPLLHTETKSQPSSQPLVLALYSYEATSADELTFHKGSVITVLSKEGGDWWRGELNGQVGLFPSNYVQPLTEQQQPLEATRWADSVSPAVLAAVSEQEKKRQEAIFELLSSERNYVDSLKLVKEVFFDPIAEEQVLSQEELSKVRVNWDELIKSNTNLLNAFLVRLRTSGAVVRNIGDVLSKQIPNLTPHIRWCGCQLTACTLLQTKSSDSNFREFEQRCMQDARTGGLPLSSFLLKPMQRITKYPLLVKRILEYTPEGDQENEELRMALEQAEQMCVHINDAVRSKENTEQLEWLQTHIQFTLDEDLIFNSQTNFMGSRKLLHWGKLFKIRGAKDLVGFLFNDFFLLVKPKHHFARAAPRADLEPFTKNEFEMYRKPWLLDGVRIHKAPQDQYGPSAFLFLHPSEEKDVPLRADNDTARDQWKKKITQACLEYMQTKKKMEREQRQKWMRTLKDAAGVLKVTVVEAADLLASDANGKSDPFCVVKLGDMQEQKTEVIPTTLNPKWNCSMEFAVRDVNTDVLEISVFDKDLFSPNDFLGCTKLSLKDLLRSGDSPWNKRLLLEEVSNGEIELAIELELKKSGLLL